VQRCGARPVIVARFADRFGAKPVVAASFLLGELATMALRLKLPLAALLAIVALVGTGTSGTQMLIYGLVANYFPMRVHGAVVWCAGFGRLGGVGGLLIAAGLSIATIFLMLVSLDLVGPRDGAGKQSGSDARSRRRQLRREPCSN